jgi:threonine/homoserine efflux transporter RhtA
VYRYKVYAFVISAGFAGLAGSLYACSEKYISPNTYNFELTILFLLAMIMDGRKTRSGALLGALIVVLLPTLLSDIVLFRRIAVAAAVLAVTGSAIALARLRTTLRKVSWHTWAALAYLGWLATILGYALWTGLLKRHPANRIAPFSLGVPVVGISAGMLLLGDRIGAWQWAGIACIVFSLAVVVIKGRARTEAPAAVE